MKRRHFLQALGAASISLGLAKYESLKALLSGRQGSVPTSQITAAPLLTGLPALDEVLGGLKPGEVTIVGGRPAMGKTAIGVAIASELALKAKRSVGYFSLELGSAMLVRRMVSRQADLSLKQIRAGTLVDADWNRFKLAASQISESKIYIGDGLGVSAKDISQGVIQHGKFDLLIFDYLQLMPGAGTPEGMQKTLKALKALAQEMQIPIIALSQLNRGVANKPDASSFRSITHFDDVDSVLFMHRPAYYDKDDMGHKIHFLSIKPNNAKTASQDFRSIMGSANC